MTTTIVNDRDVLLQTATRDVDPRANKYLNMSVTTPLFHVAANGTPYPPSIDISVLPVNITGGTVSFSVGSGGALTGTGNTRSLAFTDMTVDTLTITASITDLGQTYTAQQIISKVVDGSTGRDGSSSSAPMYATAFVYMWSPVQPSLPAGTSTWAWNTGSNTAYTGADGWYVSPPANPGTSGIKLWVCSKPITATSGTATTNVAYSSGGALYAVSQNGANGGAGADGPQGQPGVPGIKNATARAYQWGNGAAPTATGTAIWTWATASYNQLPASGWNVQKTNAPSLGYTLFEAAVPLVDSTGATTSSIDWTTATVTAIGYMATNGSQGPSGPQGGAGPQGGTGASAVIAYTLIDGATLAAAPATTNSTGPTSKPATGTWGETRAWTDQPSSPAAGQAVFQTNGIYNPANNIVTWGVPYRSDIRVGSLSAITTNTGTLNVSGTISSANGNFTVDANGAATMKAITIKDASGNTILSSGTALNPAYAAAGTLNSDLTASINSAAATANWGNVSGAGKPADYATVGAQFGVNIGGQITAANVATYMGAGAISSTYIANLSADKLTAGTIAAGIVYAGQINANQINAGTLSAGVIYGGTVNANQINAGTLSAGVVYGGTVNANQVNATSLSAISANLGTITAGTIQSGASGQRTVINQNGVNVYDGNGTLRVRLGIW